MTPQAPPLKPYIVVYWFEGMLSTISVGAWDPKHAITKVMVMQHIKHPDDILGASLPSPEGYTLVDTNGQAITRKRMSNG